VAGKRKGQASETSAVSQACWAKFTKHTQAVCRSEEIRHPDTNSH